MVQINNCESLLEKVIKNGNVYLRFAGLRLDNRDIPRNIIERLRFRLFFVLCFITITLDVIGQSLWLIDSVLKRKSNLIDITNLLPCVTVSLQACVKSFYFFKHAREINNIIIILRKLQLRKMKNGQKDTKLEIKRVFFLNTTIKILIWASILGIMAFSVGPLVTIIITYYSTGELKLLLPFLYYYPFDVTDIRVWPLVYIDQIFAAVVEVFASYGPDFICYALSTFIIINFEYLKNDISNLIHATDNRVLFKNNETFHVMFVEIVRRHNELIRCVDLIEVAYSKTILFSVISSSILICFTGFNITTMDDMVLMASFTAFLIVVLGHIYLLCFFGDMIMTSSFEVGAAVYTCQWYLAESAIVKDLKFISLRASKPCKITAYGYSDVNLKTFTKILSTSWSYFALLKTLYKNNK